MGALEKPKSFFLSRRFFEGEKPAVPMSQQAVVALNEFIRDYAGGRFETERGRCLCGAIEGTEIAGRDRFGIYFKTLLCSCGVLWSSPRLSEGSLSRFYRDYYRRIYEDEFGSAGSISHFHSKRLKHGKGIVEFMGNAVDLKAHAKVFEIGCASGGIVQSFVGAGYEAYGCDFGTQYIQYGQERGLHLEEGDFTSLRKHGRCDVIVLSHVLEHLPDPIQSIKDMSELLNEDGVFYIEVPGLFSVHEKQHDFLIFLQNAHLYHFCLETLRCSLAKANLELVDGNESVRSVFRKSKSSSFSVNSSRNIQGKILNYLSQSEQVYQKEQKAKKHRQRMKFARSLLSDKFIDSIKKLLNKN